MRQVSVTFIGITPYSQSRMHSAPELEKEKKGSEAYDKRTWREKMTTDAEGNVVIPAMALKQALPVASRRLGMQIPGRGKSTYTKFFEADVICTEDVPIGHGHTKDNAVSVTINCNSDGVRGSGKRVPRIFPIFHKWGGTAKFMIFDNTITPEVFEEVFTAAGLSVGIGRFRPENGGLNGRFEPVSFDWH